MEGLDEFLVTGKTKRLLTCLDEEGTFLNRIGRGERRTIIAVRFGDSKHP